MKHPSCYGDAELAKIVVDNVFQQMGLSDEDIEIFVLRYGYEWYYNEIGDFIGNKYRGKGYSEGAIRHRVRRIMQKVELVLHKLS